MKPVRWCIGVLFGLIAAGAIAQTGGTSERRFTLPDHGYLVMQVPRDWSDKVSQPPNRLPPTIAFGPAAGKPFHVLITPMWPIGKDRPPVSRDQLRAAVEGSAQAAKPQAVEKQLPLVELQGRPGPGFYFSATDRAPKPGEFKYVTQGMLRVSELSVAFTILTNDGQEAVVKQALDALRGAVQGGV